VHSLPRGRLLLGFSGGPDSTGLAALLRAHDPLLAYVDHRLRGPRAGRRERARVRGIARALGLDLVRARVSVPGRDEASARRERYRALHALARKHGCSALLLAHTADDRAETVLFNLLRGTGLRGLAAPRPRAVIGGVARVRPALDERRAALHESAAPFGPVRDRSNRDTSHARVRVRALLLPALAEALGADPVPLLCALADRAEALRSDLEGRAERMKAAGAGRSALLAEAPATFPYLVEALRGGGPPLTASAYASLRDFLRAGRGDRVHVTPGKEAWEIGGDSVRVSRTWASLRRPRRSSSSLRPLRTRPAGPS